MNKKKPIRQCMGCRERKEKKELLRIIRTPEGEILLDTTGRKNGRGAYICPSMECLHKAVKSRAISRSLKTEIPEEIYERLEKELSVIEAEK